MSTMGRMVEPRRLTPDVQQRIVDYIADGNYPETSAYSGQVNGQLSC